MCRVFHSTHTCLIEALNVEYSIYYLVEMARAFMLPPYSRSRRLSHSDRLRKNQRKHGIF